MNTNEIVRALKNDAKWVKKISWANALTPGSAEFLAVSERITGAADLIESMQAQLAASQRRESAAVEFIHHLDREYSHYIADKGFEQWRGQEAGKGEEV